MSISKEVHFNSNMELGVGYDDLTGQTRGMIFEYPSIKVTEGKSSHGQTGFFQIKKIDSFTSLAESLNISVEAEGSYGLFSAQGKFEFAQNSNFSSQSSFLVAQVVIQNRHKQFFEYKLKEEAKNLLRKGNNEVFRKKYGDCFVQGLTDGGEFYAIVEIWSKDITDQTRIAASLQASYGTPMAGADLKTSVTRESLKISKETELTVRCFQAGGKGEQMTFSIDIAELIEKAKTFALSVSGENAVPYKAYLKSYDTLELPEADYITIEAKKDALTDCAKKKFKYMTLLNDIAFYDDYADFFSGEVISDDLLSEWSITLTELLNALTVHAKKIVNDPDFTDFFVEKINGKSVKLMEIKLPPRVKMEDLPEGIEILVPLLENETVDKAIEVIREFPLKLKYSPNYNNDNTKINIIYEQSPSPGRKVEAGSEITIYYNAVKSKFEQMLTYSPKFAKTKFAVSNK